MTHFKNGKNYVKILNSLHFTIPGMKNVPRAPDALTHRDLVDVYTARRRLQLAYLLPAVNIDPTNASHIDGNFDHNSSRLNRHFLSKLVETGYSSIVDELIMLTKEEDSLLLNSRESGRVESFTKDKPLFDALVQGLISCVDSEKSDKIADKIRARKSLGEKMILLGDFWLARKMFVKTFSHLEGHNSEDLDKMRVELWCLLSYVCIYFEKSEQIGYELPAKCLALAQQLCREKDWHMMKSVMSIMIPKAISVYGLKNEWLKIKTDWVGMHTVVSMLLYVLYVKRAKQCQEELKKLNKKNGINKQKDKRRVWLKEKISASLTSALMCADEAKQFTAFITSALMRGLFFEEHGEWEKAMEDFTAIHVLSMNYDMKDTTAMALNRLGHNHKVLGNGSVALDYFVKEWELCEENEMEELRADALQDMGVCLLEEGHTWEAEECMSQAYLIFRETKKTDTPNEQDELSWALLGICRGQHLWGRFATLMRSQEKSRIYALYDWKSSRKTFPLAKMPQRWYKTQKRESFDLHYVNVMPKHDKSGRESTGMDKKTYNVQFDISENDESRRLFEFTPSEVKHRQSLLAAQGFNNIFDFINASNKPRVVPRYLNSLEYENNWGGGLDVKLSDFKIKTLPEDDSFHQRRKTEARRKESSLGRSLKGSLHARKTLSAKSMADWVSHDFRVKSWKRRVKSMDRIKKMMDPNLGISERLVALLDDMSDIATVDDYDDGDLGTVVKFFDPNGEEEDESDDTELFHANSKKSTVDAGLLDELEHFDDKDLGF